MAQTFGILGFLFSLLALFFASEVLRRSNHRQTDLELALFKATTRIQKVENKMAHVDRLATEVRYEKKRQAETINALAQKGGIKTSPSAAPGATHGASPAQEKATNERFTPSQYKDKKTG